MRGNKRVSTGDRAIIGCIYAALALVALLVLYPLYFVVIASLSDPVGVYMGKVILWVKGFTLAGYKRLFVHGELWQGYRNTVVYTAVGTLINMALTTAGAYALSRRDLKGRGLFMGYLVFTMFFSGGMIPTYFTYKNLRILYTFWVMVLPGAVSVYNLIIARTFFQTSLPLELLEAAKMDGCNDFRYFFRIALPLSKPILAVLTLYYAVGHWNSYFNALLYLKSKAMYPLQLILRSIILGSELELLLFGDSATQETVMIAESMKYGAIILASLPLLLVYPLVQKYFMQGVMIGAIKG